MPGRIIDHNRPMTHTRSVLTGMVGSSVFATAERTSKYGESSSAAVTQSEFYEIELGMRILTDSESPFQIILEIWIRHRSERVLF